MRVLPGLLKWIRRPNLFTLDVKRRTDFVDRAKVPELPVLDLDDQQATTRMKKMTTPSSPSVLIGDPDFSVFLQHTSASLILCENADPNVRRDLETPLSRLAPDGDPAYVHDTEGPDGMAAHVRGDVVTLVGER